MEIICIGWSLSEEELKVLKNTAAFIQNKIPESKVIAIDGQREEVTKADWYIGFGRWAHNLAEEPRFAMPAVKELADKRQESMDTLNNIISGIISAKEKEEEKTISHIEVEEKILIGKKNCDVNITEQEVEYLKSLRDLFGGSKIVLTKGDIKIEIQ